MYTCCVNTCIASYTAAIPYIYIVHSSPIGCPVIAMLASSLSDVAAGIMNFECSVSFRRASVSWAHHALMTCAASSRVHMADGAASFAHGAWRLLCCVLRSSSFVPVSRNLCCSTQKGSACVSCLLLQGSKRQGSLSMRMLPLTPGIKTCRDQDKVV